LFFFFFSSRRRHTRYWRDWSSDVCSSDLDNDLEFFLHGCLPGRPGDAIDNRSEERRVGKSVDLGGRRIIKKKKKKNNTDNKEKTVEKNKRNTIIRYTIYP